MARTFKGRGLVRAAVLVPWAIPTAVTAKLWLYIFAFDGIANKMFNTTILWTGSEWPAKWADIIADTWKTTPFMALLILAGLQMIPADVYEAAKVDGAQARQRFLHITLPLLSPQIFFVVVISLINGFQVFDQVFVMTGGGPNGATEVVVQQIYDLTFRYGRAGDAAALSWLLFVIVLAVTFVQMRAQRRWVTYA